MRSKTVARSIAGGALLMLVAGALASPGISAPSPKGLIATLKDAAGTSVGTVRFIPREDGQVNVRVTAAGLTPGFHGFHVHTTGVCDPAAQDTAGATVPFFSAGGHFNPVTTSTHGAHAGDMPPMLVTADGTAFLKFKTDRFTTAALMDTDRSAVITHAGADNLANIPATTSTGGERYHSHVDSVFGPDTATKATGDAGARFACGLVERYTG